jgi:excisionase family DNA binding protein
VPDAAFQLSVSTTEVWRLLEARKLRRTRIGKRVLVSHAAIEEFIAASTEARA